LAVNLYRADYPADPAVTMKRLFSHEKSGLASTDLFVAMRAVRFGCSLTVK